MNNIFTNPISYIGERKLLFFNIVIFLMGTVISIYLKANFDSVLHLSFYQEMKPLQTAVENIMCVNILAILLFIAGKMVNSKVRFIDVLNLSFIMRIPFYLLVLLNFNDYINKMIVQVSSGQLLLNESTTHTMIFGLVSFIVGFGGLAIQILHLYFGFKTIANAKSAKHWIILFLIMVLGIVISPYIINVFV